MLNVNYNPDVLSCLANLSSDEVFTPPNIANQMLDLLPDELWSDRNATFLDPASKSGVFLREIAKRLMIGLEKEIPDLQSRVDHIMTKQLFGIGITELTSLLARRSLYCSKAANGEFSICQEFDDEAGNIFFDRVEHEWKNGKCIHCGASQQNYLRNGDLETHAYQFIHNQFPRRIKDMKFDVIIGNPPYQLNDGGGTGSSASPIYNLFIESAKKLNPRFASFIVPARWYSGGKGLDEFRKKMLEDRRLTKLIDFADSRDCFPGVDVAGGVCYFLWERDNEGTCEITNFAKGDQYVKTRDLGEFDILIRSNTAHSIVKKVNRSQKSSFAEIVSSRMPFGLTSQERGSKFGELKLRSSAGQSKISRSKVERGHELIDTWKLFLSKASFDHGGQPNKDGKRKIFSRVEIAGPGEVCTETYLVIGPFDNKKDAEKTSQYLKSKFVRYLVGSILLTQNITKDKFRFVPPSAISTDDRNLYSHFKLSQEEINNIESSIMEMK